MTLTSEISSVIPVYWVVYLTILTFLHATASLSHNSANTQFWFYNFKLWVYIKKTLQKAHNYLVDNYKKCHISPQRKKYLYSLSWKSCSSLVQKLTSSLYICLTLTFPLLHFQLNHVPLEVKQLTLLSCAAAVSLNRTSRCHRSSHCPKRSMPPSHTALFIIP